jgi:molybdopterin-guanine dinucleotide biosynthesis protein A
VAAVPGLLLTGGASRRMGADKSSLIVGGERLADRSARVLTEVCAPVLEVGPGHTGLDAVREDPPGGGPLAAIAAGARALRELGHRGAALVLAVDLPLVTKEALAFLRDFPGPDSVVPFVAGQPQPLCARYSAEALDRAPSAVAEGEDSVRRFLRSLPSVQWVGPRMWGAVADERTFADVDTPEDLDRLGVRALGDPVEE